MLTNGNEMLPARTEMVAALTAKSAAGVKMVFTGTEMPATANKMMFTGAERQVTGCGIVLMNNDYLNINK